MHKAKGDFHTLHLEKNRCSKFFTKENRVTFKKRLIGLELHIWIKKNTDKEREDIMDGPLSK